MSPFLHAERAGHLRFLGFPGVGGMRNGLGAKTDMMKNTLCIFGAIATALGVAWPAFAADAPAAKAGSGLTLPATTPWNPDELSKPPGFEWHEGKEVRSLFYKGEPYQGKPTRVFAYYATPGSLAGDPSLDKGLPGIILVHGGGGTAFPHWAKLWASRGYAALAMDLGVRGPADEPFLADGGPSQKDSVKFATDQPATDQWTYHAVADVIRAHSLLLSLDEVDPARTALTGISWGGYLTCIVAGLDHRFKAAVPVYGCGFLHENSAWLTTLESMSPEDRGTWVRLWDPSRYVGSASMPMLFVNGGTDFAYPPDSHARTYALVTSPKQLHFVPHLPHGHIFDQPEAVRVFIDHHLKGGKPLPVIGPVQIGGKQLVAPVTTTTKLLKAELHFTMEPLRGDSRTRKWTSQPATIAEGGIRSDLPPAEATAWFLTLTDERDTLVSSSLTFPASPRGQQYPDGRPAATLRMEAKDHGIVLRHGDGPDKCDALGARDVWVFEDHGTYYMHYDAAGPKGWLCSLAVSTDLVQWKKKGPVLDFGQPGEDDSKSASYGVTYRHGQEWHMFYLGTPNVSPAPDLVPSFPYLTMKARSDSPAGPWVKQKDIVPFRTKPGTYYSITASPGHVVREGDEYLQFFSATTRKPGNPCVQRTLGIARTKDLGGPWTVDPQPMLPIEEQIENSTLYFEKSNKTWFLFTNHIGIDKGEYTDAIWVYWSKDLDKWDPANKAVVLDGRNCSWSRKCIGLPSVLPVGRRLALFYDAPGGDSTSHMKRHIGLAWLELPLSVPTMDRSD